MKCWGQSQDDGAFPLSLLFFIIYAMFLLEFTRRWEAKMVLTHVESPVPAGLSEVRDDEFKHCVSRTSLDPRTLSQRKRAFDSCSSSSSSSSRRVGSPRGEVDVLHHTKRGSVVSINSIFEIDDLHQNRRSSSHTSSKSTFSMSEVEIDVPHTRSRRSASSPGRCATVICERESYVSLSPVALHQRGDLPALVCLLFVSIKV